MAPDTRTHPWSAAATGAVAFAASAIAVLACAPIHRAPTPAPAAPASVDPCGYDASGLKAFLSIADQLSKDREPDEQSWAALENTPGYGALLEKE